MGIFSHSSPFDQIVEKATAETNTKEDWSVILDICDRVGTSPQAPKECLRAIVKRLNHPDPHVAIQAIVVLDACVSNCSLPFHLEVASRDFEQEFRKTINKSHEKVIREKLLNCLQKWAENEFKTDPQLDLIPSLYNKLKANGVEFPSDSPTKGKKPGGSHHHHKGKEGSSSGTAAAATAQQEEMDIAKAIELSLKEAQGSPQNRSIYPQALSLTSSGGGAIKEKEKESRKVRALYDFEAAEENELTFYAGEIVHVIDDTDPNWWEGSNQRGKGLFPANFVTADLSAEPPKFEALNIKKTVKFVDEVEVKSVDTEPEVFEIDVEKIDKALHFLHEADPTGEIADPLELETLEDQVQQMGPLIDQELEKIDRRHAQLTRLGSELVEALNMYHNLMREIPHQQFNVHGIPGGPPPISAFQNLGPIPSQYQANYPNFPPNNMPYQQPNAGIMMRQQPIGPPPHSAPPATGIYNNMSIGYGVTQPLTNGVRHNQHSSASDPHLNQQQRNSNDGTLPSTNNQLQQCPPQPQQQHIPNISMNPQMNMGGQNTMQNSLPGPPGPQQMPFPNPGVGMMIAPHGQSPMPQQPIMQIHHQQQMPPPPPNQINQHGMQSMGQPIPPSQQQGYEGPFY